MRRAGFLFLALGLAVPAAGCGDDKWGTVSGKVTLDGRSVDQGSVQFFPADGQSPTAGAVIKDGGYTAKVPVGTMRVEIRSSKVLGQRKAFDGTVLDVLGEVIPAKYNEKSELTAEITPGEKQLDFELTSK